MERPYVKLHRVLLWPQQEGCIPKWIMLSLWWDADGIIQWEVFAYIQMINTVIYSQQLNRLRAQLMSKLSALIKHREIPFHHDIAMLHVHLRNPKKITGLSWEDLPYQA